jgi:endonuclease/exonuclease/phosphatase family metal-dependent hydrolase
MSDTPRPTIRVAWWNTSLAPLAKRRDAAADLQLAETVVKHLVESDGVDVIALGEVNRDLLVHFQRLLGSGIYEVFDGTETDESLHYDVGVLYRAARCRLKQSTVVKAEYARGALKVAVRIDMEVAGCQKPLHFYAVHWPSRVWCHEHSAKRDALGFYLRAAANELVRCSPEAPQIVLLGDFNDDPSDTSISGQLQATRDRGLARNYRQYFYNPFWRHLGESHPHIPGTRCNSVAGTCFYPTGVESRWSTFDQIIVSSALVKGGEWELREDCTRVWRGPALEAELRSTSSIFDHLPVIAAFEPQPNGRTQ